VSQHEPVAGGLKPGTRPVDLVDEPVAAFETDNGAGRELVLGGVRVHPLVPEAVDVDELVRDGHGVRLRLRAIGKADRVNRFFRRLERFGKSFSARRSQGEMANTQREVFRADTPPDVTSTRAKSSGHGKKTADKWNQ
jgi:hypothetical protein